MISQTVEYALRAVVTIAQHEGRPCTSQEIAETTQVPGPYLSKVMQGLVRAKLVISKRGLHGGFVLTKKPAELTILDIIDAVDPFKRIRKCPLELSSHSGTLCPLHQRLDDAMAMVEESLRKTTVAEVLAEPGSVTPLCEEPQAMSIDMKKVEAKAASPRKKTT